MVFLAIMIYLAICVFIGVFLGVLINRFGSLDDDQEEIE
jgi:hypothetical protein